MSCYCVIINNEVPLDLNWPSRTSAWPAGPCHPRTLCTSRRTAGSASGETVSARRTRSGRLPCSRERGNRSVLSDLNESRTTTNNTNINPVNNNNDNNKSSSSCFILTTHHRLYLQFSDPSLAWAGNSFEAQREGSLYLKTEKMSWLGESVKVQAFRLILKCKIIYLYFKVDSDWTLDITWTGIKMKTKVSQSHLTLI